MRSSKNLKINKDLKILLLICIIASISLPIGIIMIILGSNKIWLLLILGIILTLFGFYGTPILWISFSNLKTTKNVIYAIMEENITNISELSSHLQMNEKQIKDIIIKSIRKHYLQNMIFDGNKLISNEKNASLISKNYKKCSNCGAQLEKSPDGYTCPYCGSKF